MNIRSRKSELEAAQQAIKFFETVLRASTDGIVITDITHNIIVVNEAFCSFFGAPWREVVETNLYVWLEQLDGDAQQCWADLEKHVRLEGACHDVEFKLMTKHEDKAKAMGIRGYVMKPVVKNELAKKIREVLDR